MRRLYAAALLALLTVAALNTKAHAALLPEPNAECMAFANEHVPPLHSMHIQKVSPEAIRYLVLTAPDLGDPGRWLLLTVLDAMEVAEAHGKRMSQSSALEVSELLCRLPEPGAVSAPRRSEFAPRYTDI